MRTLLAKMNEELDALADKMCGKERPAWFDEDHYSAVEIQAAAAKWERDRCPDVVALDFIN